MTRNWKDLLVSVLRFIKIFKNAFIKKAILIQDGFSTTITKIIG